MNEDISEDDNLMLATEIETIIEILLDSIKHNAPNAKTRLAQFTAVFNDEFPIDNPQTRGGAEAITWALLDIPLVLYALNKNGPAIIELYGILEAFTGRDITNLLPKEMRKTLRDRIIRRCTLEDFAVILRDLGIWNQNDIKFVMKLRKIRNGMAHKNAHLISNAVCSGKPISVLDIDSIMEDIDCIPYIIKTIHLLTKLMGFSKGTTK